MKYYLIAGEASGDLHASHLMHAIQECDKEAKFRFIGGDLMLAEGGTLVRHYRSLAYMGVVPVLIHLPQIIRGMKACKSDILQWKPDVLLLVDYPSFNLSIAKHVRHHAPETHIFYYIPPKIWAWKEWRIREIRSHVDHLLSILPFEIDYYHRRHHYDSITYVGNPTLDEVTSYERAHPKNFSHFIEQNHLENRPAIALLAGSRRQEIRDNLSRMLQAAQPLTDRYQLIVAGAPGIEPEYYDRWTQGYSVHVLYDKTYPLLQHATAALVTSGTATLETALFRVPQVVCYYTACGRLISFLRRLLIKVPYISLVNLVADREVVPELVADGMTVDAVRRHLLSVLPDGNARTPMLQGYDEVRHRLGAAGAPNRTADTVFALLHSSR